MLQSDGSATPTVVNLNYSILANHLAVGSSPITLFNASTINLNRNLFFNNYVDRNTGQMKTVDVVALGGGPNQNPGVVNGASTDLNGNPGFTSAGPSGFDYSISATGAAANQATGSTVSTDIANTPRQGVPDIGAYEAGTPGAAPAGSNATGAASPTGTPGIQNIQTSPPPPPASTPVPTLVGYPQFLVGPGQGGGPNSNFYNPDGSLRNGGQAFDDASFTGGVRTAAADFNGDGIADLVVGTGPGAATEVRVLDGVDRHLITDIKPFESTFTGGVYVAAGDVTGDGVPDLVITPDEGGGPRCRVFDGRTFNPIADFFGISDPNFRGGARAAIGDVNGDGVGDLIVAAGFQGGPRVAGFDGKTLASGNPTRIFGDFFAFEQTLRNGVFVAVGDVDGDGNADVIVGGGPGGGPRVTVFSGKGLLGGQQIVLANFFGGDPNNRGGVHVAVKNLDGDNKADLVIGGGDGSAPLVTSYLGKNIGASGTPPSQFSLNAFDPSFTGGVFVG
jgi:hypothetical protein